MAKKSVWQVVPALLTLALVACEESITGVVDRIVESEAVTSVAAVHPTATSAFVSWWPGEIDFLDIADPGAHHIVRDQGVTTTDGGVVGQAYLFTGAPGGPYQFLEINDNIDFRPTEFTIDLWAQRRGNGQGTARASLIQKPILDHKFEFSGLSYFISWTDDADGSRKIVADVAFNSTAITGPPSPRLVSEPVGDGQWVHVALTVDSDRNVKLYLNGVLQDSFEETSGELQYGTGSIVIGNNWQWAREPLQDFKSGFNGCIDEVRILDGVLSAGQIEHIYDGGVEGTCPLEEPVNTAPVVDAGPDDEIDEGDTFTSGGSFTDPDADSWTATVDYGDGSGVENLPLDGKNFDLSHQYADNGTYEVTVTVDDQVADPVSDKGSVVVNNVAPTVEFGPDDDATIFEGGTFAAVGSFTDPGVGDSWTAEVDYGDGTILPLTLVGKNFDLDHMYEGEGSGPFPVTVTVEDGEGQGVGTAEVTVIYPVTIDQATVRLDKKGRPDKDAFDVDGRIPLSLLQRFDPAIDDVTVSFASFEQVIPAGSFVRKDEKWEFKVSPHTPDVRRVDLHDDGRFKIQARGPFDPELGDVEVGEDVDFSLSFGPDIGEASIQLDERRHFRRGGP